MFALCEAQLRLFTIASKLALYSLARALLYAKLGCARLQLQASSHCTRWHELCDDENSCK